MNRAVVIAVVAVRVMQVAGDEVIDVVTVRDRLVAATVSVDMGGIVSPAIMRRSADFWIRRRNAQLVLFDTGGAVVMQVAVVQEVRVAVVLDGRVAAILAVVVIRMLVSHVNRPLRRMVALAALRVHGRDRGRF